jgi:hypothetical protein
VVASPRLMSVMLDLFSYNGFRIRPPNRLEPLYRRRGLYQKGPITVSTRLFMRVPSLARSRQPLCSSGRMPHSAPSKAPDSSATLQ